jgi:NADH:ubiquinone oxidoreductase subunit C
MLVYEFLSILTNQRLTLNFFLKENIFVNSISNFYNSVEWSEREIWDMFGIFFGKHFELRRLLTDYGFTSFPLRKEFPVSGFVEIFYDDFGGITVFEKAEFMQEMRKLIPML